LSIFQTPGIGGGGMGKYKFPEEYKGQTRKMGITVVYIRLDIMAGWLATYTFLKRQKQNICNKTLNNGGMPCNQLM